MSEIKQVRRFDIYGPEQDSSDGDLVYYSDFAELEEKFQNLAAENMQLKVATRDMLSGWKEIRRSGGENEIYGIGWDRSQSAVESALNAPATTQALNEIKAQAIESALDDQVGKQAVTDELTGKVYLCAADIRQFAASLRGSNEIKS